MNFSSWRSMANRLRPRPLRFTWTAQTPGNIRGYKYAGNCLILSYRLDDPGSPFSSDYSEDRDFLASNFGGNGTSVFVNVVTRPYLQCFGNGAFAKVINYRLVQHSKKEKELYLKAKAAKKTAESDAKDEEAPLFVRPENDSTTCYGETVLSQRDRAQRLLETKHSILEAFAERSENYLDRLLCISPSAIVAALNYGLYKHSAVHAEFNKYAYAQESKHTKSELSAYSKKLYQSYVKGTEYTFLSYSCRSVDYQDGSVFLPLRLSIPKQCRLGIAFDIMQHEFPARLLTDYALKPSRYNFALDPTGEKGFYVQLVYWFRGETMRKYHSLYSEDTPGVNFFHYTKGLSVGL